MAAPRPLLVGSINFLWYLLAPIPILALGYAALLDRLPGWFLLIALFAFFMWLFSLAFARYAALRWRGGQLKDPRQ